MDALGDDHVDEHADGDADNHDVDDNVGDLRRVQFGGDVE